MSDLTYVRRYCTVRLNASFQTSHLCQEGSHMAGFVGTDVRSHAGSQGARYPALGSWLPICTWIPSDGKPGREVLWLSTMAERGFLRDVLYETAGRRRHDSDALRVCRDEDDGLGGRWTFADSDSVPQLECSGLKVAVHSAPQYQLVLLMEQRSQRPVQCLFLRLRTRLIWSRNRSPLSASCAFAVH